MRDRLREGVALFNEGRWFEAHEAFEDLWRAAEGPRRDLYQGLCQVCAGLVKHERGEPRSAAVLMRRGLGRMETCPPGLRDGLDAGSLTGRLWSVVAALEAGLPFEPPSLRSSGDL